MPTPRPLYITDLYQGETKMRILFQSLILAIGPVSAFAAPVPLPEPESLSLLAIGAIGLAVALYRKKK